MENQPKTVTIDGKEYQWDELSEEARNQLANLRLTDTEVQRLNVQLAITKTARSAYMRALADEMAKSGHVAEEKSEAKH